MYKISELASQDINAIMDYTFVNFGAGAMISYHSSLEKCFETIDNNPKIGLKSDYVLQDYFCFNHRSHVVYYQIKQSDILVVRILHQSMDVTRHLQ